MLLFIEIALTIAAWQRGWKARALLPMAIVMGLAMVIGFGVGASGGDVEAVLGLGLMLDLGGIVALSVMTARGHRPVEVAVPEPAMITGVEEPSDPKHEVEFDRAA